ncbi:DNA cytosine methyltransferase [Thiomicrolovo sp. ZZH C-3]
MTKYRVADFFCGGGGFSEGFHLAGFDVVFAVDKWEPAVLTHHMNHPKAKTRVGDVITISNLPDDEFHELIPDTEVIIGSPPCTFFSNSNKSGKADKTEGIALIKAYLRIVARKKFKQNSILKYWVLENVPNVEKYIESSYSAADLGLEGDFTLQVKHESSKVYNAKMFGVASKRLRYLCGDFPEPQELIRDKKAAKTVGDIQKCLGAPLQDLESTIIDPNYGFEMPSKEVTDHHYIREIAEFEWKKAKRMKQDKGYMGRMSFPEDVSRPSRTVMATMSHATREALIYAHGDNSYRSPTVREIASIMSFPIDYRFYGDSKSLKYKLVGNAVSPRLSYAIAKAIGRREGLRIQRKYKPRLFDENQKFLNLNEQVFKLNIEQPKKLNAKFKYHIPYLKINAMRVELTNYRSDFDNQKYRWDVEVHYSQGPNAKVYKPLIHIDMFPRSWQQSIDDFIFTHESKLSDSDSFQRIFCMTEQKRKELSVMGPMELLENVKGFLENRIGFHDLERTLDVEYQKEIIKMPEIICLGYYILVKIISKMQRSMDERRTAY